MYHFFNPDSCPFSHYYIHFCTIKWPYRMLLLHAPNHCESITTAHFFFNVFFTARLVTAPTFFLANINLNLSKSVMDFFASLTAIFLAHLVFSHAALIPSLAK